MTTINSLVMAFGIIAICCCCYCSISSYTFRFTPSAKPVNTENPENPDK
tara:strand:- start:150032 stop:150178 length:147 start_codon:yes stop_codon:yes gene_type:complete